MLNFKLFFTGLFLAAAACTSEINGTHRVAERSPQDIALTKLVTAPNDDQARLIDQIAARYSGATGKRLRADLRGGSVVVRLPDDPEGQQMIDELKALRAPETPPADFLERTTVAIALVAPQNDPLADAIVERRPDALPHDVIMLADNSKSPAALASAIHALKTVRLATGDIPAKHQIITIRTAQFPRTWGSRLRFNAINKFEELRSSQPRELSGVGTVRATNIFLAPSSR
jgi:hypothetical protein